MITGHDALAHPSLRSRVWEYFGVEFDPQYVTDTPFTVVPDGGIKLMYYRKPQEGISGVQFIGAHARQRAFMPTGGAQYWAVQFVPGTPNTWLPGLTDCAILRDTVYNAEDISGTWATVLCAQLQQCHSFQDATAIFEQALLQLLPQARPLDREVMCAVEHIASTRGECEITDLAARTGLSERQLLRRFTQAVGLTPKQFVRAWRIFSAVVQATRASKICWSDIAAELGFADQSHLTHEFAALLGYSPQRLAQLRHEPLYSGYATEPMWAFGDDKGAA